MSKNSEAVKRWRKNTKARMVESMGGKCCICNYNKTHKGLDFHHLDPSIKEHSFGNLRGNIRGWETIVNELRKCVLVCCRCHAEIHDEDCETVVPDNPPQFNEEFTNYKILYTKDECPVCRGEKPIHQTTCSYKCAARLAGKIDWDNIDVIQLVEEYGSFSAAGRSLSISGAAVSKQYKKKLNLLEVV